MFTFWLLNQIFTKSLRIGSSCRAQPEPGEFCGESTNMPFCLERDVPQLQTLASWITNDLLFYVFCCDWQEMKNTRVERCNQLSYSSGDPTLLASTGNDQAHA